MALRVVLVGSGMIPIPPPGYGAVEKYIWNLSEALEAHGVEAVILNEVVGEGGLDEYRWAFRARRRLQDLDPDLVHVHTTGVGATFATLGPDYVYTSHSRHWAVPPGDRDLQDRFGVWMDVRALRGATEAIALTDAMADRIFARAGVRPHVAPTGVDLDAYRPAYAERSGDVVLSLGAVMPAKRFHVTAEALAGLACTYRIVGPVRDEAYADRLRSRGVELLGSVDEETLRRELARGDVFVHPSTSEGLSMAVLEAMASGLPLVASDICVGQVEHGENGYAVPVALREAERVEAFRDHVQEVLEDDDLREELGRASRRLAEERYSWDVVAERTADVYRKAAGAR